MIVGSYLTKDSQNGRRKKTVQFQKRFDLSQMAVWQIWQPLYFKNKKQL